MKKILELLEKNSGYTAEQLSRLCGIGEEDVKQFIREKEADGTIAGYPALINWDKTDREYVTALIELGISPKKGSGFDEIADIICGFPEVNSVYLMSGGYDLCIVIEGRTLREVALFVSSKLAVIDGVLTTKTHFVLKKYKDKGITFKASFDKRGLAGI